MSEIKALETRYNGYRFRSRLEARWAVFFDTLGIEYQYEPEGFKLNDGTCYLPDFYLPHFDIYAEVKPFIGEKLSGYIDKGIEFLKSVKKPIIYLFDFEWDLEVLIAYSRNKDDEIIPCPHAAVFAESRQGVCIVTQALRQCYDVFIDEHGGYSFEITPVNEFITENISLDMGIILLPVLNKMNGNICVSQNVADAIGKAKSARFEHGEKG